MIRLLPYSEYEMQSKKSPDEIGTILKSVTDLRRFAFFPEGEFVGQVDSLEFRIVPRPPRFVRNSFLPVIKGRVREEEGRTVIHMKMGLNPFVRVFLFVWFGMYMFFLVFGILSMLIGGETSGIIILFSCVMILLVQLLMRKSFHFSAKKAIERLEELLY